MARMEESEVHGHPLYHWNLVQVPKTVGKVPSLVTMLKD
jgi:hypothetical protein